MRSVVAALLAVAAPWTADAQSGAERREREDGLARAIATIRPDAWIRVSAHGSTVEGRYADRRADSISIRGRRTDYRLAIGDLTSIWIAEHKLERSAITGAKRGAAIGAGLAAFLAWRNPCDYCFGPGVAAVLGVVPGVLVGTLTGVVVGYGRPVFRRLYP